MQVTRWGSGAHPVVPVIWALLLPVVAAGDMGEQASSYVLHYFTDADGIMAVTHSGAYQFEPKPALAVSIDWSHDIVVFPAIDAPQGSPESVDAITSASRPITGDADASEEYVKTRDVAQTTTAWKGATAGYYVSTESDYFAQMVSASYSRDLLGDNLNLAVTGGYGWDDIRPLADDGGDVADSHQKTRSLSLVATRILTPTTVIRLGAEGSRVSGLQHDPYRSVYVAGAYISERHPDARQRGAGFIGLYQYMPNRSSVKLDYRIYGDDWGIASHMLGGKLTQRVTDALSVQYRYRYYAQGASSFFLPEYLDPAAANGYRTGDYRMGEFGSHLFGGRVYWDPEGLFGKWAVLRHTHVAFGLERYFNSSNFTANVVETVLEVEF